VSFSSEVEVYHRAMIVFAFFTVYTACAALVLAVVWQDRHRTPRRSAERDPRATHGSEFVFRTQA
jgi:hypothetical protein